VGYQSVLFIFELRSLDVPVFYDSPGMHSSLFIRKCVCAVECQSPSSLTILSLLNTDIAALILAHALIFVGVRVLSGST
jgi:hypothetical protein